MFDDDNGNNDYNANNSYNNNDYMTIRAATMVTTKTPKTLK